MKNLHLISTLPLLFLLVACYATDSKTGAGHSLAGLTKDPSAKISHEDGWTIVSKIENGDRVHWFLAPEVDNVSPAMFKKIIYTGDKSELDTKTVSQCEAPKQTCDDLMKKFKSMSEKYQ
ncbi:hypothetical protein N9112_03325 [bacterium]|jgi:hypothetical protein|nr:hypothetical protein [bacterium]